MKHFDLPISDLLFKVDPEAVESVQLMPSHWVLYERLLDLADDNGLILGADAPKVSKDLYNDLIEQQILAPTPVTYHDWVNTIRPQKIDSTTILTDQTDESNMTDDDLVATVNTSLSSATEVDLDFLD